MNIGAWLLGLGLERYEALLRDNAVDLDILPELTEADLEKLGLPLGDRKRILKAAATLVEPPPLRFDGERRPVTVMFCDLVGSTRLSAALDPEDWRELVGLYFAEAGKVVSAFGGHVQKKLGDGLMVLFGYPRAQENDAERAVRAALGVIAALAEVNAGATARGQPELSVRIGLDSGPVVMDATGEVFGEAPNVAARVQTAAAPGAALVTAAVLRQIAGLFIVESLGPQELKGVAGRPALFRILRPSGGRRSAARALTPFVGRDEDVGALMRRWERTRRGESQFVHIVGEPGLGKSRLIQEFRSRLSETPHTWIEWSASQLLQNTPLHPMAEWGRHRFGGAEVAPARRLVELERALSAVGLDAGALAPLLAPLLDIPLPEGRGPPPEELRRRQRAGVVDWVLAGARVQPLVLALEDLQWADPTSLDLLHALIDKAAVEPLFVVATSRPDFRALWPVRAHHTALTLAPLDRLYIRKMVAAISERHALPSDVVEGLSDRTGGVPLFVEEVTRLLLEGGAQTIPPTLQQSLTARLDRLGEAREVAQIGAVLGREFTHALLQEVARTSPDAALATLLKSDLLFVEGAVYRFKHALIQDAAYESLLKSRRLTLHRRAAEALIGLPEPQPELIAHHFTQAGQTEAALVWWEKAGEAALRRHAFQEAAAHLGKAIALAERAGAPQLPKLQKDYAQALMWAKGFAAAETQSAFARARASSDPKAAPDLGLRYAHGQYLALLTGGDVRAAKRAAEQFLGLAESSGSDADIRVGRRLMGLTYVIEGEFAAARDILASWADPAPEGEPDLSLGLDSVSAGKSVLAMALLALGDFAAGEAQFEAAMSRAEALKAAPGLANVMAQRLIIFAAFGAVEAAAPVADELFDLAQARRMDYYVCLGALYRAWARGRFGDPGAALKTFAGALEAYEAQGNSLNLPFYLLLLGQAAAKANESERALAAVERGLAVAERTGHKSADALLLALRGALLMRGGQREAGEASLREGLEIARRQQARSFETIVALALAESSQSAEGRAALAQAMASLEPHPALPATRAAYALLRS